MNFFIKKKLIKFSCTFQPLSFCKILKKFLEPIQSYENVPFSGPKWPICSEEIFLVQTIITFIYLLAHFIVQNFKKFLQPIQNYYDAPFLDPKWSICRKYIYFQIITIILIYLLAPFILHNLKKILPADPELWRCAIFGPKMAHFPKWEFFSENLFMSLVSFIHAYLHAKNQSQTLIY